MVVQTRQGVEGGTAHRHENGSRENGLLIEGDLVETVVIRHDGLLPNPSLDIHSFKPLERQRKKHYGIINDEWH
jgi:hypothetical protein